MDTPQQVATLKPDTWFQRALDRRAAEEAGEVVSGTRFNSSI